MRKSILALAVIISALFLTTSCKNKGQDQDQTQAGQVNNFRIKRGTNVSHWLSQSEQRGEARRLHIQEDDFARLKELDSTLYVSPSTRCSSGTRKATSCLRLGIC